MKNSIYFNNADDYDAAASSTTTMFMGLGSDVGVYFNNLQKTGGSSTRSDKRGKRGRPSRTNHGVDTGIFCVGRVQKLRVKVGTKWGMCWHPIDLMKCSIQNAGRGIVSSMAMVYLHWFKKVLGINKYKYDESDCIWVDVDSIISTVSLHYALNTKIYTLDEVDAHSLHEFVSYQK